MFENITQFFKRFKKSEKEESKSTAKERLHLVLAQDRANISADFLEMMKQEIIEVIKESDALKEHWKNYQSKFSYAEDINYEDTMRVLEEIILILMKVR